MVEHPREKRHKCTISVLKGREGLVFLPAEEVESVPWGDALLLHAGADSTLSPQDIGRPLVLVDASWRWAERVVRKIRLPRRRLPPFQTAYPRKSKIFRDPPGGLASAEALFVASLVFGVPDETYLDGYRWKETFLASNAMAIRALTGQAGTPQEKA
ncbi:MAG: hypothetical protein ACYTHM_12335 [Planctomycetota bacterium]